MSDLTRDPHDFGDPELRARLTGVEPPAHGREFWRALDARLDIVGALRGVEPPDHRDGFWASFDARLWAEPERDDIVEVVAARSTVFLGDEPAEVLRGRRARRARRAARRRGGSIRRRATAPPRLQHLVQLSAAAAIVALLAGALAWWGTRDSGEPNAAAPVTTAPTTTAPSGPSTTAPPAPLINNNSRVQNQQPAADRASVPVGASPDGKYLYVAGPAPSAERCSFGSAANAQSTVALWLYAQPIDGSQSRRILTDRVFADPKMAQGPNDKVVVSDSCNGSTTHVIASVEANGALSIDRVIQSAATTPLAVDGAAWSASGTGLYLRGEGTAGWFRYDLANASLAKVAGVAPNASAVQQLANDQVVSVTRLGTATWSVSVGDRELVNLTAPSHGDFARAVRIDARHGQLAVAGKDTLVVLTARPGSEVGVSTYQYAAQAVTWAADGNGLVAAPLTGGLDYLSFAPTADNHPAAVSLGFEGIAYNVFTVPDSSSLVVRQGVTQGESLVAGEAFLLRLTS